MPCTSEAAWLEFLAGSTPWRPPLQPTLVVAPHPDDETLAAGGLIASLREAGCEVTVVAVTDGENCYPGEQLAARRTGEQTRALARLGVDSGHIHRLHLPDSGVTACEGALEEALAALSPPGVHLVAPWSHDFHPDHEVCGRVAKKIAERNRLPLSSYFFWTWHRGTPDLLASLPLQKLELSLEEQTAKRQALEYHESQLVHPSDEPILPELLLAPAYRTFEVFLSA